MASRVRTGVGPRCPRPRAIRRAGALHRLRRAATGELIADTVELIADKNPRTPSRWSPREISLRAAFSTTQGGVLGGGPDAAIAAAAPVGATFAGSRLRVKVHRRDRQPLAAAVEDALSYSLVLAAASSWH